MNLSSKTHKNIFELNNISNKELHGGQYAKGYRPTGVPGEPQIYAQFKLFTKNWGDLSSKSHTNILIFNNISNKELAITQVESQMLRVRDPLTNEPTVKVNYRNKLLRC